MFQKNICDLSYFILRNKTIILILNLLQVNQKGIKICSLIIKDDTLNIICKKCKIVF